MARFEDHGLPLVRFKEHRRDLVVALTGSTNVTAQQIAEIAVMQHSIAAIEAVIADLDSEEAEAIPPGKLKLVHSAPPGRVVLQRSFGQRRAC